MPALTATTVCVVQVAGVAGQLGMFSCHRDAILYVGICAVGTFAEALTKKTKQHFVALFEGKTTTVEGTFNIGFTINQRDNGSTIRCAVGSSVLSPQSSVSQCSSTRATPSCLPAACRHMARTRA